MQAGRLVHIVLTYARALDKGPDALPPVMYPSPPASFNDLLAGLIGP